MKISVLIYIDFIDILGDIDKYFDGKMIYIHDIMTFDNNTFNLKIYLIFKTIIYL